MQKTLIKGAERMEGNETRLVEFMDGSKKRFAIPIYQRNYDWKQENCKQLFDDLEKVEWEKVWNAI